MKQTPILFSGPMVRAILDGRKTKTRRVGKIQSEKYTELGVSRIGHATKGEILLATHRAFPNGGTARWGICEFRYGNVGCGLYVKEHVWMWCERKPNGETPTGKQKWAYVPLKGAPLHYCADHPQKPAIDVVSPDTGNEWGWRKKLGRFMPRWASRITLEIVSVRVERLQEISEEDAIAEGVAYTLTNEQVKARALSGFDPYGMRPSSAITPQEAYRALWDSINADKHPWASNPWVWVLEFKRV